MWRATLERTGDAVAQLCGGLAAAALLLIVAINGANVVGRYVFGAPLVWAEEAMLYLMIAVVFAGGAVVSWRGSHMRLEVIVGRAPPALRRLAVFATTLCGIVVLLAVGSASLEIVTMLYAFDQRSDALHLPMWIPQSIVLGGFGLFAALMALRLVVFGTGMPPAISENVAETIR